MAVGLKDIANCLFERFHETRVLCQSQSKKDNLIDFLDCESNGILKFFVRKKAIFLLAEFLAAWGSFETIYFGLKIFLKA